MNLLLTNEAVRLLGLFITLFLVSLLLGNFVLLSASLVPLLVLLLGLTIIEQPSILEVKQGAIKRSLWVGEVLEVSYNLTVKDGMGVITLAQELPLFFQLVDGNNLRTFWKGLGDKSFSFSYKVKCTKRGSYVLPKVNWESRHLFGLRQTLQGSLGEAVQLTVKSPILNVRRIRGVRGIASSPYPVIDIAKIGVPTTDFREIRSYVYGDPVTVINWKATARLARRGIVWPLVNEYETEGKKTVWIFLDDSSSLEIGTSIENVFEYSVEAANAVAFYFLNLGYRVGMYIYNDGNRLFYPDVGKKQFHRLSRELTDLKTSKGAEELPQAVEKCRKYILNYKPLCVIITRLDGESGASLIAGVRKIRALQGRSRRQLPVMVIGVAGYDVISSETELEENTLILLRWKTHPTVHTLRRLGASVAQWNPKKESLGTMLLKQVRTR